MQITITLTDDEVNYLKKLIENHTSFETRQCTVEDAIHDCIRSSMFEEGEEASS